jgi:hypothetical protein
MAVAAVAVVETPAAGREETADSVVWEALARAGPGAVAAAPSVVAVASEEAVVAAQVVAAQVELEALVAQAATSPSSAAAR